MPWKDEKRYKVMYKLRTHGLTTDWILLVMRELYSTSICGPGILSTIHWRMSDISEALSKMESDATRVVEFRVVEVTDHEALADHLTVCQTCNRAFKGFQKGSNPPEVMCFAGKELVKYAYPLDKIGDDANI